MNILLVYPKYPDTFWSFKHVLKFVSKKAAFPPLGLLTIGAMLPVEWNKKLVDVNIDDIKDAYVQSDLLIAPIYGPGGTRYKILEAMATGLPVITTSTGVEGLDITHGKQALIKDNPEDLASEIVKILNNPKLYKTLAENGRKLVEEKYNWERIAQELDKIYERAVYG